MIFRAAQRSYTNKSINHAFMMHLSSINRKESASNGSTQSKVCSITFFNKTISIGALCRQIKKLRLDFKSISEVEFSNPCVSPW